MFIGMHQKTPISPVVFTSSGLDAFVTFNYRRLRVMSQVSLEFVVLFDKAALHACAFGEFLLVIVRRPSTRKRTMEFLRAAKNYTSQWSRATEVNRRQRVLEGSGKNSRIFNFDILD